MWNKKAILICLFIFGLFTILNAQQRSIHTNEGVDCSLCHDCKNPTKKNPCLKVCPRPFHDREVGKKLSSDQGPDFVVLDVLEELYDPVVFSHKTHAEMANMSGGCVSCHHFTPTNQSHPPCKECHSVEVVHKELKKPCLKAAYHRQCIACHQDWSGEANCEKCHVMKQKKEAAGEKYVQPHYKKCNDPDLKIYETSNTKAPIVTFFHSNHSHFYCLKCSDCHRDDPCVRCHYQGTGVVSTIDEESDVMHHKCSACHDVDNAKECSKCHSKEEKKGFDHGRDAGWVLNIYHSKLSCDNCHPKNKRLGKLNRSCVSCHSDWNAENFNHAVVGLELDEIHIEADCSDCHVDRKFNIKPTCTNCHDETPKDKPGKVTKKGK